MHTPIHTHTHPYTHTMFDLDQFATALATARIDAHDQGCEAYHTMFVEEVHNLREIITQYAQRGGSRYRIFKGFEYALQLSVYCEVNGIGHVDIDDQNDVWFVWHCPGDELPLVTVVRDPEMPPLVDKEIANDISALSVADTPVNTN